MNYVFMDTSNIVLWVSVSVRNMNVRLRFDSTLKLYQCKAYKSKFYV